MEQHSLQHNILFSCATADQRGTEDLVTEHVLTCLIAGESKTFIGDQVYVSRPGAMTLIRRNTLLKIIKYPEPGGRPYQSLAIFFTQATLKNISTQENLLANGLHNGESTVDFTNNIFLKGYFDSLLPYFKTEAPLASKMAELKTREAIELLLRQNSSIKNILFDFSEPFKIDLEAFMNRNYIYHMPLSQFARLSGRSMATFKRDFKKVFTETPERWIQQKRLERAHFLISEQKQSPAAVYCEVGFETLSHFSVAFKKHFGYNPSTLT
jgi:AraC-like DNA-binding protein